jgi:hypothetical protein
MTPFEKEIEHNKTQLREKLACAKFARRGKEMAADFLRPFEIVGKASFLRGTVSYHQGGKPLRVNWARWDFSVR